MTAPKLTELQVKQLESLDQAIGSSALEGQEMDPRKIEIWKGYVLSGMSSEELTQAMVKDAEEWIRNSRAAGISFPKKEYPDYPGMKHMGNGYYLSGDVPEDPPVK
jgi:hypothetical protein